ncbi:hypothetical protein EsHS_00006808 [Epichloe bromicola]
MVSILGIDEQGETKRIECLDDERAVEEELMYIRDVQAFSSGDLAQFVVVYFCQSVLLCSTPLQRWTGKGTVSALTPSHFPKLAQSPKSVNELLANLRHSAAGPSSSRSLPTTSPSVPPAIREILQIPETPSPVSRRPVRQRFDINGRRLPAGPAPPRSWLLKQCAQENVENSLSRFSRITYSSLDGTCLPGSALPHPGSLIDITLKSLAANWDVHRVYNQYHLYFIPSHLKSALIRYVGLASEGGISLSDLRTILVPPEGIYGDDELDTQANSNSEITFLDLSASMGRFLRLKDVLDLLFNNAKVTDVVMVEEVQESWEAANASPSPPRLLLPNLTHLSLALDPQKNRDVSWKQLLTLSSKLPTLTHLSLAYWPEPCLTPRAKYSTISAPHGQNIPYGGTTIYSHSLDHDWSEALLVLRMLSNSLYELEFLDLTGCAPWFQALQRRDGHDYVDWSGTWGKVTGLRLFAGWTPGAEAMVPDQVAYTSAVDTAKKVERHIRTNMHSQEQYSVDARCTIATAVGSNKLGIVSDGRLSETANPEAEFVHDDDGAAPGKGVKPSPKNGPFAFPLIPMAFMSSESAATILCTAKQTRFHVDAPNYRELDVAGLQIKLIPGIPEGTRIALLQQSRLVDENDHGDSADENGQQQSVLQEVIDRATARDAVEQEIQFLSDGVDASDSYSPVRALRSLKHERLQKRLFRLEKDARLRSGARGMHARKALVAFEKVVAESDAMINQPGNEITPEILQRETQEAADTLAVLQMQVEPSRLAQVESKAKAILAGLGFSHEGMAKPISSMSGGWHMRAALAAALLQDADILMLDEPTNFLDLLGIVWLQRYLQNLAKGDKPPIVVVVSHDRDFISVCTHLMILRDKQLAYFHATSQPGKASDDTNKIRQAKSRQKKLDDRMGMQVNAKGHRFKLNGDLAGWHLTSREEIDIPPEERRVVITLPEPPDLRFPGSLLSLQDASFRHKPDLPPVVDGINLTVGMGDRIGILGLNGAGKSTLIRMLVEDSRPTSGSVTTHPRLRLGYYSQHAVEAIKSIGREEPALTALGLLAREVHGDIKEGGIRGLLGELGLPGSVTTHLDYETATALRVALNGWQGAMVLVSHDRRFMRGAVEGNLDDDHDGEESGEDAAPRRRVVYRLKGAQMVELENGVEDFENLMQKRVSKLLED